MPKQRRLTQEESIANRKAAQENSRKRVRRFTLQFSLKDSEALAWFEQQPDKGAYLKQLILDDKNAWPKAQ